ncbi:MAG TPA: hypothetical protein VGC41_11440, partial [Kofleriaceae bacterium]
VKVLANVAKVFSGEAHTCAIKTDGSVVCWGYNFASQVGDGTYENKASPTTLSFALSAPDELAPGDGHTCALTAGQLQCWGADAWGQLGDGVVDRTQIRGVSLPCE